MEKEVLDKMWNIDSKGWMGEKISDEEKRFYNEHLEEMINEMYDDYLHWKDAKPL